MRWLLLVLVAVGCTPRPSGPLARALEAAPPDAGVAAVDAAATPVDASTAVTVDAGSVRVVTPPLAAGCPARYGQAPAACSRDHGLGLDCRYPEGTCYCGFEQECRGDVASEEEERNRRVLWQCLPNPPAIRPDGCPGTEPSGACSVEGKQCSYGNCCVSILTCQRGQWQWTGGGCPP